VTSRPWEGALRWAFECRVRGGRYDGALAADVMLSRDGGRDALEQLAGEFPAPHAWAARFLLATFSNLPVQTDMGSDLRDCVLFAHSKQRPGTQARSEQGEVGRARGLLDTILREAGE
jgi:hypothetical protein